MFRLSVAFRPDRVRETSLHRAGMLKNVSRPEARASGALDRLKSGRDT